MRRLLIIVSCVGWGCASASAPAATSEVVVVPAASGSAPAPEPPPPEPAVADPRAPVPLARVVREELVATTAGSYDEDAQLFRTGNERELAGDLGAARKGFYDLIRKYPASPLIPYAYLAFGDMFASEAEQGDASKWELARQAYTEVIKYPPPANRAYAYAWHRAGVAFARAGENAKALDAQKKALQATRQTSGQVGAERVAEAAARELALAYASAGRADAAVAFFRTIDARALPRMVILLGEEYVRTGAVRELVALYQSALAGAPSEELCRAADAAAAKLRDAAPQDAALLAQLEPQRRAACRP